MHRHLESLLNELRTAKALRADGPQRQGDPRFDARSVVNQFEAARNVFDASNFLPRYDSDEAATLARQLLFVQAKEVYQQFTALKATKFIPVDGSVPSGASAFTTPIYSQSGVAKIVTNYGNGFPSAEVKVQENISPVRSIGDSYHYTIQDIRAAAMAGQQPLDQRRATVARMVHDRKVERIAAWGDSVFGLPGFLTATSTPAGTPSAGAVIVLNKSSSPAITGGWESATPAQIYTDLVKIGAQVSTQSQGVFEGNTLLLPIAAYELLAQPYSTLNPTTILDAFLAGSTHIRNIEWWSMCDNLDEDATNPISNSTKTRGVVYQRDPMVLDLKIPQQFEQFAPQLVNMQFNIPCHSRIGGVPIYYPAAVCYVDDLVSIPSA